MAPSSPQCDFCASPVAVVYEVPESRMGMQVAVCESCGLVQSLPTREKPAGREVKASSGADWGNIRHGKGLRFDKTVALLERHIPWDNVRQVLDIGANRGHFVLWCRERHPHTEVTAVEPDPQVVERYAAGVEGVRTVIDRIENVALPPASFDLVYSLHTLEHARSAREMVRLMRRALKPGGYLFLEVPNIDVIGDPDVVEEFFIDKHTFHFQRGTLIEFLEAEDFTVVWGREETDRSNITLILRAGAPPQPVPSRDRQGAVALVERYQATLHRNREKLKTVAARLTALAGRQAVVCWGGGRIFDALVRFGGLDARVFRYVIDRYLAPHLPTVHGVPLKEPQRLRMETPDVVVILAKSAAAEIEAEVRRYGVRHVVKFQDLLTSL